MQPTSRGCGARVALSALSYADTMRRIVVGLFGAVLLVAIATRLAEVAGKRQCGCHADCWCKKPGLRLFRWVIPGRAHHRWTAEEKRAFEAALGN